MKYRTSIVSVPLVVALATSGCANPPSQEAMGAAIGGVLGGVIGSQIGEGKGKTAAIIVGTLAGAMVGSAVGRSMDELDRMKTAQALETSRTGQTASWRNPDTGHQYSVTPTRTYQSGNKPCRDFTVDAVIGGRLEKVNGTACRQPDGTWRTQ